MMSAKDQSTDVVEALELGANDYITKPLDLPVLLARVQAQLRTRPTPRSVEPERRHRESCVPVPNSAAATSSNNGSARGTSASSSAPATSRPTVRWR